ncbi:hypothetical protein EG329_004022 [Mollisiaceae sp. DMI_Dod_QoI]|nr:hypothetical protein EG329_004022 [Helotiales sp. DMI_Dod_QoI]
MECFRKFSHLPPEIRHEIWGLAAPIRPRIIQVYYNVTTELWQAWDDSCGGLSTITRVSHEARQVALKEYCELFRTWVHLECDTIFVSDPMITIPEPRDIFLNSEYAKTIQRLAFSDRVLSNMEDRYSSDPIIGPTLTRFPRLKYFTHVLEGFFLDSFEAFMSYTFGMGSHGNGSDGVAIEAEAAITMHSNSETPQHGSPDPRDHRRLSDGFTRHVGDIRFESAAESPDDMESWREHMESLAMELAPMIAEKPDWDPPRIAIAHVRYGLNGYGEDPIVYWPATYPPEVAEDSESAEDV